jgi:hypothetical protein
MKVVESKPKKSHQMLVELLSYPSPRPEGRRFFRRKNRPELIVLPQIHSTLNPLWDTSSGSFEESQPQKITPVPRLNPTVEASRPSFLDRRPAPPRSIHVVFTSDELRVSVESFNASEVNLGFSFASLTSFPTLGLKADFRQNKPPNPFNQDSKIEPHFAFWLRDSPKKGILRVSGTLRN